ncbi:MAG: ABC-F family ATP-binding cassette domain-containing protein [Desulfobacterales bacterium]|nr:ABC-F family ATP-binding cassette domain-containing protein [Desulfobacterales bacterium]
MPSNILISTHFICKSFGAKPLFTDISLQVRENERMGLIGPNGAGKSTLLKILGGTEPVDSGEISRKRNTRTMVLPQEDVLDPGKTIEETLFQAVPEGLEPWQVDKRRQEIIDVMAVEDTGGKVKTLSGGWRKKMALGQALFQQPDLLLMDEPTNHLDLEGILWLEQRLKEAAFAFVLVSHDRFFLEHTTTRIVELNRRYPDGFFKVEGNYSAFVEKREAYIQEQEKRQTVLSNKVRREIEWLRRGPKARTTKAKYRVGKAHRLQEDLEAVKDRNAQDRSVGIAFDATGRKTKMLLEAKDLGKSLGGRLLFDGLSLKLSPGMVVGVMGRNGTGKSTLIQILGGRMAPDAGFLKTADGATILMLDQQRGLLDEGQSLRRALAPEGDTVIYAGRPFHVTAWAKRFLFEADQLGMPVSELSGGEKARVLIANLMLQPADVLLLDEPTNDLDIPTLQVLEDSLEQFAGAVVLITHDRFLMERLCDLLLYLDGEGGAQYFADYDQWLQYLKQKRSDRRPTGAPERRAPNKKPKKPAHEERKELFRIERQIEKAEALADSLQQQLYDPAITSDADRLAQIYAEQQEARKIVDQLYRRWEQLESGLTAEPSKEPRGPS